MYKKNAVDLTELAIGIIILGIAVTIGALILVNVRDSRLTSNPAYTVYNESVSVTTSGTQLGNQWCTGVTQCFNATGGFVVNPGNYSVASSNGICTISNLTAEYAGSFLCTNTGYNTTNADWDVANNASIGLGEYGNWFKIIVIVGVASIVLGLIFTAFGRSASSSESGASY